MLSGQAFILSAVSVLPIHFIFIYNVKIYVFNIGERGFVYIDEILKLIIFTLLTSILNMISNEFGFLPTTSFSANPIKPKGNYSRNDNEKSSDTTECNTHDIKASSPNEKKPQLVTHK